jgi:uncharacterized protein YndB with AHSA1/START domain
MNEELGTIDLCYRFSITRTSKHSPARLWRAITDSTEVARWMSCPRARVDLRVGGEYHVSFLEDDSDALDGVIVAIEPERLLRYAWGTSVVDWAMEPASGGCTHTFSQNGLASRDIADEEGLVAGWHAWFEDLDNYLDSQPAPLPGEQFGSEPLWFEQDRARWLELGRLYRPLLRQALGDALKGPDERLINR